MTEPQQQAAAEFAAEVAYWRKKRKVSQRKLAADMGFDASYVSKMEGSQTKPTADFAQRADGRLQAGGAIIAKWQAYEATKADTGGPARLSATPSTGGSALVVEQDEARLDYDGTRYTLTMRRKLRNTGDQPVTRYLIRISVDRYPEDPALSNAHYREHPLTWDILALTAHCAGEPMAQDVKLDRDATKEVWLLFENPEGRFPLYPGESVWIEYSYHVPDTHWGRWFQRAVRLPTEHLLVELRFPTALDPVVWGTETSMTAEASPLRTAPTRREESGVRIFRWETATPDLHARYRLEWRLRARQESPNTTRELT
ncbi:helix-turn-helix transcriptional regulator [Streptomyces sp. A1547]|uniref:helix-turn-helix domain-containing protein n=1 Tax=Streptomyces sp. A1547 TaxID=2563105 RepID=UPI00109EB634|nr:helix-turn-helix transcriptional regulator [Streptomyces sp. A1547]THA38142.1 XRE family transcriptional regulator [Streptomyces sp. A1547]